MISLNSDTPIHKSHMLAALLAIGLAGSTPAPAFAQTSGTWSKTGSMNAARKYHTATLLQNGQVLVAGGTNGSIYLTSAELYNPSTGKWALTGSMNTSNQTATLLQSGQVLAAGGGSGTSSELYNPAAGTWTITGSMTTVRVGYTATLLSNGQVLVAGCQATCAVGPCPFLSSAELYDPSTGTWTATGSMNQARAGHTATLLTNGKVLVAAGDDVNGAMCTAELYNPSTGTWTFTGNLNINRDDAFGMLLSNGEALVLDGHGLTSDTAYAELYNPSTGTWTLDGGNNTPGNTGQTLTLLGTKMVLTAGGTQGVYPAKTTILATCSLSDPSTANGVLTGSMTIPRQNHTATVLQNGQVLAAGGETQNHVGKFSITNTAELYTP